MHFEDFQRNADGTVDACPAVAFETFVPHGVLCGLILHYLESPGDLLSGRSSSLPLLMTPRLARELAAALTNAADEAELGPQNKKAQ